MICIFLIHLCTTGVYHAFTKTNLVLPCAYRYRIKYLNLVNLHLKMSSFCLDLEQKEYVFPPKALPAGQQLHLSTTVISILLKFIVKNVHLKPHFSKLNLLYVVLKTEVRIMKGEHVLFHWAMTHRPRVYLSSIFLVFSQGTFWETPSIYHLLFASVIQFKRVHTENREVSPIPLLFGRMCALEKMFKVDSCRKWSGISSDEIGLLTIQTIKLESNEL